MKLQRTAAIILLTSMLYSAPANATLWDLGLPTGILDSISRAPSEMGCSLACQGTGLKNGSWKTLGAEVKYPRDGAVLSEHIKLMVVKLDLSSVGTETATLYVDPTPGGPEPVAGTVKTGFELGDFTNVAMNGGGAFSVDEIRIGTTFSSVTPTAVPEPSSWLFLSMLGLGVGSMRFWRRYRGDS